MNLKEMKNQVDSMDVKSDEFWELYKHIADKYFTIEDPDDFQTCAKLILGWLERSTNKWEDQVITVARVVEQVFMMRKKGTKSCTGTLGFTDETFFFDIYTTETEKDKLGDQLFRAHKAMEKGNYTVKDKFGKKYFKKIDENKKEVK